MNPPNPPEFMTWIEGRRTNDGYKVHKSLGHAGNSIHGNAQRRKQNGDFISWRASDYDWENQYEIYKHCKIFKWNGTGWDVLFDIPAGTSWADRPWRKGHDAITESRNADQ